MQGAVSIGEGEIAMPLANWVKNLLMAAFFFSAPAEEGDPARPFLAEEPDYAGDRSPLRPPLRR